jgi:hypothetical protein
MVALKCDKRIDDPIQLERDLKPNKMPRQCDLVVQHCRTTEEVREPAFVQDDIAASCRLYTHQHGFEDLQSLHFSSLRGPSHADCYVKKWSCGSRRSPVTALRGTSTVLKPYCVSPNGRLRRMTVPLSLPATLPVLHRWGLKEAVLQEPHPAIPRPMSRRPAARRR